jgi:hypothetical protein
MEILVIANIKTVVGGLKRGGGENPFRPASFNGLAPIGL